MPLGKLACQEVVLEAVRADGDALRCLAPFVCSARFVFFIFGQLLDEVPLGVVLQEAYVALWEPSWFLALGLSPMGQDLTHRQVHTRSSDMFQSCVVACLGL